MTNSTTLSLVLCQADNSTDGDWGSCNSDSVKIIIVTKPYFHSFKAWSHSFKLQSSRISKITKPFRLLSSAWGYPREVVRVLRPLCATGHRRRLQNRGDYNFSRNCQIYTKDGLQLQPIEALHWELFFFRTWWLKMNTIGKYQVSKSIKNEPFFHSRRHRSQDNFHIHSFARGFESKRALHQFSAWKGSCLRCRKSASYRFLWSISGVRTSALKHPLIQKLTSCTLHHAITACSLQLSLKLSTSKDFAWAAENTYIL